MEITRNVSLKGMNTFRMDVKAACLIEYDSVDELSAIFKGPALPGPFLHIGGGSNLLFTKDFQGTVLHSRIRFIEYADAAPAAVAAPDAELSQVTDAKPDKASNEESRIVVVRAGAGVVWDDFCAWCAAEGLWGAENLSLIPGEVGAAAVQNIGAYGREAKDIVRSVDCFDTEELRLVTLPVEACSYGYRESLFKHEGKGRFIVTAVNFALTKEYSPDLDYAHLKDSAVDAYGQDAVIGNRLSPALLRDLIIKVRKGKLPDPAEIGSAGSFFRNPVISQDDYSRIAYIAQMEGLGPVPHFAVGELVKVPAAWMIEKCGWKGFKEGNVGVYDRQPLVIVNLTGKATPSDVIGLEERIIASVREKFGVPLNPEVEHV